MDSTYITIGIPEILIISKADNKSLSDYYKNSIRDLNNFYEEDYLSEPEFFFKRKAIIVFTGKSNANLFTQNEIDSLTGFVSNGGKVLFTGQNIAEYLEISYPDFLHDFVGIDWTKNASVLTKHAYGVDGDLFGSFINDIRINGNNGASNQISADVISPTGSFNISLTYNTDGTNPAGGWITKQNNGKIFFLGFGFEGINDNESTVSRTQVMNSIFNWFEITTDVEDENETLPLDYSLYQNYPNPFNPATKITFTLPSTNFVSVKVFNLLGEEVVQLLNEEKTAGKYSVEFDASKLSSGIYFYKLDAGKFSETKKMMFLK
jgi:hypothetical protein